jgi:phage baseplate assembly protein W
MAKRKFLGSQYPLKKTPRGTIAPTSGVDQIKADLLQLLLTNPGERVMLPTFGVPLRKLFFEPNDIILENRAYELITKAIQTWEPRIELSNVQITSNFNSTDLNHQDFGEERDAILGVKIDFYDPEKIDEIQSLTLEVPLAG